MRLSGYERETVINYNQSDTEASVYTYAPKLIRRLQMLSEQVPDRFRLEKTWPFGAVTYVIPKKYVAIRKPVSDTQREALRESAISGQRKPPNRSKHSETDTQNLSGEESVSTLPAALRQMERTVHLKTLKIHSKKEIQPC